MQVMVSSPSSSTIIIIRSDLGTIVGREEDGLQAVVMPSLHCEQRQTRDKLTEDDLNNKKLSLSFRSTLTIQLEPTWSEIVVS